MLMRKIRREYPFCDLRSIPSLAVTFDSSSPKVNARVNPIRSTKLHILPLLPNRSSNNMVAPSTGQLHKLQPRQQAHIWKHLICDNHRDIFQYLGANVVRTTNVVPGESVHDDFEIWEVRLEVREECGRRLPFDKEEKSVVLQGWIRAWGGGGDGCCCGFEWLGHDGDFVV